MAHIQVQNYTHKNVLVVSLKYIPVAQSLRLIF